MPSSPYSRFTTATPKFAASDFVTFDEEVFGSSENWTDPMPHRRLTSPVDFDIWYSQDLFNDRLFQDGMTEGLPSPKISGSSSDTTASMLSTPDTTHYPEPYFVNSSDMSPLDSIDTSSQFGTPSESSVRRSSAGRVQKLSTPARAVASKRTSSYPGAVPAAKQEHAVAHAIKKERTSYRKRTRTPHNVIEQRYRDNLNTQIERLRLVLSDLPSDSTALCTTGTDASNTTSQYAPKAVVIETAASLIREMAAKNEQLSLSMENLQARFDMMEKISECQRRWIEHSLAKT